MVFVKYLGLLANAIIYFKTSSRVENFTQAFVMSVIKFNFDEIYAIFSLHISYKLTERKSMTDEKFTWR